MFGGCIKAWWEGGLKSVLSSLMLIFPNHPIVCCLAVEGKEGKVLTSYTDYFPIIQPKEEEPTYGTDHPPSITELEIIYVAAGLFTFLLLLTFALCTLLCFYRRRNKHLEEEEVAESLSGSLG